MEEISSLTPTFKGVSYEKLINILVYSGHVMIQQTEIGSEIMHVDKFVREKGKFLLQNTLQVTKKLTQSFRLFLRLEEYCHNTMLGSDKKNR